MSGVLLVTHGRLGDELIKAAELIRDEITGMISVSVDAKKGVEDLKKEITAAIKKADTGKGVLILTDLFGGTPSNISLSFLKKGKIEVLTGVNLPMLLKISEIREQTALIDFANSLKDYGKRNIRLASEILNKKVSG